MFAEGLSGENFSKGDEMMNGTGVSTGAMKGTVEEWNDAKGFGWVKAEGKRYFIHIKECDRRGGRRPRVGDEVAFSAGKDEKGRICARGVSYLSAGGKRTKGMGFGNWMVLGMLLVVPGLASLFLPFDPWYALIWGGVASVFTAGVYFHDKKMAELGGWRIPESFLHFMDLMGGWPGAFVAQRALRHKISKRSYQLWFWLIVAAHQVVALDVFLEGGLRRWVMGFFDVS